MARKLGPKKPVKAPRKTTSLKDIGKRATTALRDSSLANRPKLGPPKPRLGGPNPKPRVTTPRGAQTRAARAVREGLKPNGKTPSSHTSLGQTPPKKVTSGKTPPPPGGGGGAASRPRVSSTGGRTTVPQSAVRAAATRAGKGKSKPTSKKKGGAKSKGGSLGIETPRLDLDAIYAPAYREIERQRTEAANNQIAMQERANAFQQWQGTNRQNTLNMLNDMGKSAQQREADALAGSAGQFDTRMQEIYAGLGGQTGDTMALGGLNQANQQTGAQMQQTAARVGAAGEEQRAMQQRAYDQGNVETAVAGQLSQRGNELLQKARQAINKDALDIDTSFRKDRISDSYKQREFDIAEQSAESERIAAQAAAQMSGRKMNLEEKKFASDREIAQQKLEIERMVANGELSVARGKLEIAKLNIQSQNLRHAATLGAEAGAARKPADLLKGYEQLGKNLISKTGGRSWDDVPKERRNPALQSLVGQHKAAGASRQAVFNAVLQTFGNQAAALVKYWWPKL